MEQEIIEGNKLIAEVDGCWPKYPSMDNTNKYSEWLFPHGHINAKAKDDRLCDMKYHTSWDWLMPCLKETKDKMPNRFWSKIFQSLQELEISITWPEFVEFLKWYNQNKK